MPFSELLEVSGDSGFPRGHLGTWSLGIWVEGRVHTLLSVIFLEPVAGVNKTALSNHNAPVGRTLILSALPCFLGIQLQGWASNKLPLTPVGLVVPWCCKGILPVRTDHVFQKQCDMDVSKGTSIWVSPRGVYRTPPSCPLSVCLSVFPPLFSQALPPSSCYSHCHHLSLCLSLFSHFLTLTVPL